MFEKYMSLKDIKSSIFPMTNVDDADFSGGGGTNGGADSTPAGESASQDVNLDTDKGAADDADKGVGSGDDDKADEPIVELDGVKFTAAEIEDALKIKNNQAEFTAKNQAEAERLNTLQRVIEETRQGLINQNVNTPASGQPSSDLSNVTAEQFRDNLLGDNPSEAIAQLVNFINQTVGTQTDKTAAESAFLSAHPEYLQTLQSSEYKAFIASNPMGRYLNDVNGFLTYKLSTKGTDLKAAETKGFDAGEKTAAANAKAKSNLKIFNGSGGATPPAKAQITPDTSHGDVLNAATNALIAGRAN